MIPHPTDAKPVEQEDWERNVTQNMILSGWQLDRDDETTLGFSFKTRDGGHWVRDYDKKTRSFVHFDATHRVSIRCTSLKESVDTLVEGIKEAYKQCPDSENKTFEEVAHWAGQHVLLTEKKADE